MATGDGRMIGAFRGLRMACALAAVVSGAACAAGATAPTGDTVRRPSRVTVPEPSATGVERSGVVELLVEGCDFTATGSGFVVGSGEVVTNFHVIEDATEARVRFADGLTLRVNSARRHRTEDLASLSVSTAGFPPLRVERRPPPSGEIVRVLGFPRGGPFDVESGRLVYSDPDAIYFSAIVEPGNSGGPLVDADGRVIGVVVAIMLKAERGRAIPAARLLDEEWTPVSWKRC